MLRMAQVQYIKDLYENEEKGLREISRITGHSFETVQKYAQKENWNEDNLPDTEPTSYPVLGEFIPIVDGWLEADRKVPRKQRHTAWRLFCRLRDEYGFRGSYSNVKRYVRKKKYVMKVQSAGFLPLERTPGCGQVDFGEFLYYDAGGQEQKGYALTISFPHSNMGYEQAIIEDLHTVTKYIKHIYSGLPVFLFSHSMGTLVARGYLKRYDSKIDKVVLCGPPTYNAAAGLGLLLARLSKPFIKEKAPNKMLNAMAFSQFNAGNSIPNGWLSENQANVAQYNQDPKCGFIFTTNGFVNLLRLQKAAFEKRNWHVSNPHLPILVIAGEEDPVIRSRKRFEQLIAFLSELGYTNISSKLYEHMRHEILNEEKKLDVYKDILLFYDEFQHPTSYSQV